MERTKALGCLFEIRKRLPNVSTLQLNSLVALTMTEALSCSQNSYKSSSSRQQSTFLCVFCASANSEATKSLSRTSHGFWRRLCVTMRDLSNMFSFKISRSVFVKFYQQEIALVNSDTEIDRFQFSFQCFYTTSTYCTLTSSDWNWNHETEWRGRERWIFVHDTTCLLPRQHVRMLLTPHAV